MYIPYAVTYMNMYILMTYMYILITYMYVCLCGVWCAALRCLVCGFAMSGVRQSHGLLSLLDRLGLGFRV